VGKAHYTGKDVTAVRSPHRQRLPDIVGPEPQKLTALRGIANKAKADKRHRFRELSRCLDAELGRHCWQDLHKEAASGGDQGTADA
jgi:RNA-directed DNA polymerase